MCWCHDPPPMDKRWANTAVWWIFTTSDFDFGMHSGERPVGAANDKQTNTMASCHTPTPCRLA